MDEIEECPEAPIVVSTKHLCESRSFGLLSENMMLSENVCCNSPENEELRTGAGESKEAVVRTREAEDALDEAMPLNNESKLRKTKSCICVLHDVYRHSDHTDRLQLNANTKLKKKEHIAWEFCVSGFLETARLLDSEDSRSRSPCRAAADLGICSENITQRIHTGVHNLNVSCDMCRKNEQNHDFWWSLQGSNFKQVSMECKQNYKKQTMRPEQVNRYLPRETKSDTILNTHHPLAPDQVEAHHKQAGVLTTTVFDTSITEHGFVHCKQSVCCLCNEEICDVYYPTNNVDTDLTARDEIMDSSNVSSCSSAADAVLTKSDNPEKSSHCKYFSMKPYSFLDGHNTKAKEGRQWRKEEIHENKLDKQELKVDIVEDHKVPVVNITEADSVFKRIGIDIEESNCEMLNRKDKSDICMFEKVYEGKDELDKMLHNTNSTLKNQDGVASEQCISYDNPVSNAYYTSGGIVGSTWNIPSYCRLSNLNLEMISKEHGILEEIVTMFNSQDLYKVLDGKVIQDFKNYFSNVTLLISANRNKSGNSGYSPTQYPPGAGNTRKKCKKPDPTMYDDEGNRSQKLQSCLEKVRLACALHSTIGHMRNRSDHHAAVMAYEQSIKDLETLMKTFLELNVGNATKDKSISVWHPLEIDNPQRRTRKGAKHHRGQNALRRSETFVVEDPCSHNVSQTLESKRDTTDLCVQNVCNQQGKMCVNGHDVVDDAETFIFSSDSTHSACLSPALLSTDTSFNTSPATQNRLYLHGRKVSRASRHSSLDSKNMDSEGIRVSESRYRSTSHDSDVGTSECLSLPEGSGEQEHRLFDLAASRMKSRCDKISERAHSNSKETTFRRKFSYEKSNRSTLSDLGVCKDELEYKVSPKYSAGSTYPCRSLRLPKVPVKSQSLNDGNIISQNDQFDLEPSVSNNDGEVKKHITSISDVYLPICDRFCSVNDVTNENCYYNHKRKSIQEFLLTQKDVSRKDIQDTTTIDTSKISHYPALNKDVNECSRKHDMCRNLTDKWGSVNETCRQVYHPSSRKQACLERSPCSKHCFVNNSSSVQMKSSQECSSHSSVGSHKKWRLPNVSRKNTFFQVCADMFLSRTDWSGSDEDANGDSLVDLSPNDMIYNYKSDVNTKLDELNWYAQRRKKNTALFQKRASTNTPSWVDNAENVTYLNNKSSTLDTQSSIYGVKHGYSEGAHTVDQNEQFTTHRDKTVTGKRKCTHLNLTDSQNIPELVSVTQPVDTVNKEEGSKLHKHIHKRSGKSLDVVENRKCEPMNNDWSKATEHKNNVRSKDTLTTILGNISRGTLSQERYIDASYLPSTKSDENVRPASQSCKESTSETGFKSNNFESKFTASTNTYCSHSMSQSHETGFVSDAFTTLTQTQPEYEEAVDFSLSDLSSNILASTSTNAGHSCSQEHENPESVSTLVLSKSSSGTFINQSCSDLQTSKVTFHCSKRDNDNDILVCSKKMNETEQRVREISMSQPQVIKLPYPFCFVSLKDEQQVVYQGAEDITNGQNRSEGVKHQNDDTSAICYTGVTKAETSQMFSVKSPPKCLYSGIKQVNYSYLISISANPVILGDKEIRCSADADGKGTCPFLIVGEDLDSSSQDENDTADFAESATKRTEKHALNVDSSNDVQFNDGSTSSVSRHEDGHVVKHLQRTRRHNQCVPLCITTKYQHTNNDPLTSDGQIVLDRRGDFKNKRRSIAGIHSLHTDLLESQESRCQSPCSPKENEIIKHLSDKVKYLESMLEFTHFTNFSLQRKDQNIDSTKDLVLPKQPYYLQCVAAQLDQTQLTSSMHYSSNLHPGCCIQTTEYSNPGNPENCNLRTPCRCVQNACSLALYPVGYHCEDSEIVGRIEDAPCISTACQTEENSKCTSDTRLRPCTMVDSSTQYDADLSGEGAGDITRLLQTQMAQIHADIEVMKRDALLESFQSLRELVSDQKQELQKMSSKMETITSSLGYGKDDHRKKGEDQDTMKARIVELTSQRDAEKMFHKITRQALRCLERDHDRLRQEFFHANCRRFRQGESRVQKRVWYHLNGDDTTCHCNTNHSNIRRHHPVFETVTSRHPRQEKTTAKYHRH